MKLAVYLTTVHVLVNFPTAANELKNCVKYPNGNSTYNIRISARDIKGICRSLCDQRSTRHTELPKEGVYFDGKIYFSWFDFSAIFYSTNWRMANHSCSRDWKLLGPSTIEQFEAELAMQMKKSGFKKVWVASDLHYHENTAQCDYIGYRDNTVVFASTACYKSYPFICERK